MEKVIGVHRKEVGVVNYLSDPVLFDKCRSGIGGRQFMSDGRPVHPKSIRCFC